MLAGEEIHALDGVAIGRGTLINFLVEVVVLVQQH